MTDDLHDPTKAAQVISLPELPALRREALLPNERGRGLGTVAVVCTMAGVASGLALATTLMAMQVADSMSTQSHQCAYVDVTPIVNTPAEGQGYLGIGYHFETHTAFVDSIKPNTPAEAIGLQPGDRILAVDGLFPANDLEFANHLRSTPIGAQVTLMVVHADGSHQAMRPTLIAYHR